MAKAKDTATEAPVEASKEAALKPRLSKAKERAAEKALLQGAMAEKPEPRLSDLRRNQRPPA